MEYEERYEEILSREYPTRYQALRQILEKMRTTHNLRVDDGQQVVHFYMSPTRRLTLVYRAVFDDVEKRTVWSLMEYEQEAEESKPTLVEILITNSRLIPAIARVEKLLVDEQTRVSRKVIPETYGDW